MNARITVVDNEVELVSSTRDPHMLVERITRVCYNSEERMCDEDPERNSRFLKSLISRGHHSVFEHASMTMRVQTSRGISHEIVRHRLCSYTQASTRYINMYDNIHVVRPHGVLVGTDSHTAWLTSVSSGHDAYRSLIDAGAKPEIARDVLPNCLATIIYVTANAREWRHILTLRGNKAAHPHMREVARGWYKQLMLWFPVYFEDIDVCAE